MKLIKLLIIVLSLSMPIQSYACWDDDWDDNYDPWDDEDDPWGDDDNDWSAWDDFLNSLYGDDWNYDGNNSNDDDIYKEIDLPDGWECVGERPEPEYPIIDISDYWDRYFDSDDSNSDDNGFNDDSDEDDRDYSYVQGDNEKKSKSHTLKNTDKLSVDLDKLNKQKGFKQGTNNTCVSAGLEFVAKVLDNTTLTEGKVLGKLVHTQGLGVMFGEFRNPQMLSEDLANIAKDAGFESSPYVSNIKNAIDNGEMVMTTIPVISRYANGDG